MSKRSIQIIMNTYSVSNHFDKMLAFYHDNGVFKWDVQ